MEFFPSRTVALSLFGLEIHWYGIMYALAAVAGYFLLPRLARHRHVECTRDEWLTVVTAVMVGVVLGGRLGFVLFYEPMYFLRDPLQIFAVWKGGMASHGGFVGATLALVLVARRLSIDLFALADIVIIPVAIGLAFGRLGNFINQELYGVPTSLPWGIAIPGVQELRHPTQLYAVAKDLGIAFACFLHLRFARPAIHGRTVALFLVLYGVLRFLLEVLRVQMEAPFAVGPIVLTRGQLLTVPIFVAGVALWVLRGRARETNADEARTVRA